MKVLTFSMLRNETFAIFDDLKRYFRRSGVLIVRYLASWDPNGQVGNSRWIELNLCRF